MAQSRGKVPAYFHRQTAVIAFALCVGLDCSRSHAAWLDLPSLASLSIASFARRPQRGARADCACAACVLERENVPKENDGEVPAGKRGRDKERSQDERRKTNELQRKDKDTADSDPRVRGEQLALKWANAWPVTETWVMSPPLDLDRERKGSAFKGERKRESKQASVEDDLSKFPEYGDHFLAALPLAGARQEKSDRKNKLGKGKQAATMKHTFLTTNAAGSEASMTAVTKEFKRCRNWQFFLHNEYVALARLSSKRDCPRSIPKVLAFDKSRGRLVIEFFQGCGRVYLGLLGLGLGVQGFGRLVIKFFRG